MPLTFLKTTRLILCFSFLSLLWSWHWRAVKWLRGIRGEEQSSRGIVKLDNFPWVTECLLYSITWHCFYQETSYGMKALKVEKKKKKRGGLMGIVTGVDRLSCRGSLVELSVKHPSPTPLALSFLGTVPCPPNQDPWEGECIILNSSQSFVVSFLSLFLFFFAF